MAPAFLIDWLDTAPLWQIGILLILAMIAASLVGWRIRRRQDRDPPDEAAAARSEGQEGYIVSGVLGLLALLMGFTFGLAVDRFETRRHLVLEEANAIGTTYLRTQLLEAPHRERISHMLVAYTDNRIALATAPRDRVPALLAANDALITDLWTATVAAFPSIRGFDFSSSYIDSMNDLIDHDAARKAARQAKVPREVYAVLIVYIMIASGVMGYVLVGRRGRAAAAFLFALFAMSLLLIIDIDQPSVGGITESQGPMQALRASLAAQPPAVFDRLNGPPSAPR